MNRKLAKLIHHPVQYFKDMLNKHELYIRKKKEGYTKYSVVCACYNAEMYLDAFFKSLVKQRLDFKNNIFCIMIDDGSKDNTKEVIAKWQEKFPNNILYIYKENGGPSSARNLGLKYASTPWLTFIDPDDFINVNYFYNIDKYIQKEKEVCLIATNIIYYIEKNKTYKDSHPLNYKFKNNTTIVRSPLENSDYIQLSAASSFFQKVKIIENALQFDESVKPGFEDANFIFRYIYSCKKSKNNAIAFLKKSKYYYRKREAINSLVDLAWKNKYKYNNELSNGCLELLKNYEGNVYLYNIIIYEISWYINNLINNQEKIQFLSQEERNYFLFILDEIFKRIPDLSILNCNLPMIHHYLKLGILYCFKKHKSNMQNIVYVKDYDFIKQEIKILYFDVNEYDCCNNYYIDNIKVEAIHKKVVRDHFCGRVFIYQKICWISIDVEVNTYFSCKINGLNAKIICMHKSNFSIKISDIVSAFEYKNKKCIKNRWLLIDRNTQADDNAEHLYRWISNHHPEKEIYFGLNKDSKDWDRLKNEGFNLLEYGSRKYENILLSCSKIISSQIDDYIINYFGNNVTDNIQIIFLQHGVTKDDISRWINGKKRIDLLVTCSKYEYNSILSNESRYKITDKEVKLLGFPRHDALKINNYNDIQCILIMPTWRMYLFGRAIDGNIREKKPNFAKSNYAKTWQSFLHSERLRLISKKYRYSIIFYPHPNIQQYLNEFDIPDYILVKQCSGESMQKLFKNASLMITDYSSVAFEMAYLEKPIIYYQFDENDFFSGSHVYQKGYFDYRKDGFGPVLNTQEGVLNKVEDILKTGCVAQLNYKKRMQNFFEFHDTKCCERVYEAICDLDKKNN